MIVTPTIVALMVATKLVILHKRGKQKLRLRLIHSKKSWNLPRKMIGMPRALSYRALNEVNSLRRSNSRSSSSRQLYFDEGSGSIFAVGEEITAKASCDDKPEVEELSLQSSSRSSDDEWDNDGGIWV